MPTVGILANPDKPAAREAAARLGAFLQERGVTTRLPTDGEVALLASDFLVVLGGDGTLLGAARLAAPRGIPLLGVHVGRFGFLTETNLDDVEAALERVLEGGCPIHERMMVQCRILRADGSESEPLAGMNDVVVASRAVRMVYVQMRIGGEDLAIYAADGVIVASPTGSTGYSLSAGGPLVHPGAAALIVTPIAPHTLSARSLVVPDTETIHLTLASETRDAAIVTVDGQIEGPLAPGDTVCVTRAPFNARLLTPGGPGFYQKIRTRWHYGERLPS